MALDHLAASTLTRAASCSGVLLATITAVLLNAYYNGPGKSAV